MTCLWKPDWDQAKKNLTKWWHGQGMVLHMVSPRSNPVTILPNPSHPKDLQTKWLDPVYRCDLAETAMSRLEYLADSFPYFDTQIGPGSLGAFLGSGLTLADDTVWYSPIISDPDACQEIILDTDDNLWWDQHMLLIQEGLRRSDGRYLVGMPDLIENMDTLAALRDNQLLLFDLVERPAWVLNRLSDINKVYFQAFSLIQEKIKDEDGGNAFSAFCIWGPGKTAKLQCDFSAMISPKMFRTFVYPYLEEQCRWLDFSMYHLDGTTAIQHLDALLEIDTLNAIEWTPQAGKPGGGSPEWFELYRRIKDGQKAVQVIGVQPDEVIPLLDAIGPKGTYIMLGEPVEIGIAEKLVKAVEPYRS